VKNEGKRKGEQVTIREREDETKRKRETEDREVSQFIIPLSN
jgi:hypothetical protein